MLVKSFIDMSRPNMLYAGGLGIIMLVSLLASNVPGVAVSNYLEVPFKKELCAALFFTGTLFGMLAMHKHMQRSKSPWRIPQSQISIPYLAFFATTLLAVLLAR